MIPMSFLRNTGKPADYLVTGTWSKKAIDEAKTQGAVQVAFDGKSGNFNRTPTAGDLKLDPNAAYAYYCSNETIQGVQFPNEPNVGSVPLVCDMSSDILSRPVNVSKHGIIFACAQKNAGPAGVTIVIIRDDLLAKAPKDLPSLLNYPVLAENKSLLNTPPTFAIYMVKLVTDWLLRDIGGLDKMYEINRRKSGMLYDAVDSSGGFYLPHADKASRSIMNVPFKLADTSLEDSFLKGAAACGLVELKGHRSVGGFRASIYNAMPEAGVAALRDYMLDFAKRNAK
jgi:phosphoserine aminotransferase